MEKPRVMVFSDMGESPNNLVSTVSDQINEWLLEQDIDMCEIDTFQANMTAGQDGENNNALWFCYTVTIVYVAYIN